MYRIKKEDITFLREESKKFLTKSLHWAVDILFNDLKEIKTNFFLSKTINLPYFSTFKGDHKRLFSSVEDYAKRNNFTKNGNYFNIDSITRRESIEFQYAEPPVQVSFLFEPTKVKGGTFKVSLNVKPTTYIFNPDGTYAEEDIDDSLVKLIKNTQGVDITKYKESVVSNFLEDKIDFRSYINSKFEEFVVKEISWLIRYLNMSDYEKGDDILRNFSYVIDEYLDRIEIIDDPELNELIEENEWEALVETLQSQYPKVFNSICSDIVENIFSLGIIEQEIPTWAYFREPEVIKNQWLIHFTNSADDIAKDGFDYLVDDISKLGLTTYMSKNYDRSKEGYGFSYLLSDYIRYGKGGRHSDWKYGKESILFLASGVRTYHITDEEYQTIFKGDTVQSIVPIVDGEEMKYAVYNKKDGRLLYENDDMENVVDWVVNNYIQYRKVL